MSALFSVVVATRNRPVLLARALASISEQVDARYEVILVDDGTEPAHAAALEEVTSTLRPGDQILHLPVRTIGHGQSYSLNFGAARASGEYLCFLDDDDRWIDPEHLKRTAQIIAESPEPPDSLYFRQIAKRVTGELVPPPIWIEALDDRVRQSCKAVAHGAYRVDTDFLMTSGNFCHLNTSVVRRDFFLRIGGLAETIRYENDREFYLRCIDQARTILYAPITIAEHSVPDPGLQTNMSTIYSQRERWLAQLSVYNKVALTANHPKIRRFSRLQRGYTKKKMAMSLAREGLHHQAFTYAVDGLASGFSIRWFAMTMLIGLRAGLAGLRR